jgi:hypothetical protein
MGPQLEALTKQRADIYLRIVDIGSWNSAVAQQHGVRRLPGLWLYEDGKLVATDPEQALQRLQ